MGVESRTRSACQSCVEAAKSVLEFKDYAQGGGTNLPPLELNLTFAEDAVALTISVTSSSSLMSSSLHSHVTYTWNGVIKSSSQIYCCHIRRIRRRTQHICDRTAIY